MDWLQAVDTAATLGIATAGAAWGAVKIRRRREHFPRVEFTVDVEFVALHQRQWIVSLDAFVSNKGFVRYPMSGFEFEVRYAQRCDPLTDGGPEIGYQTRIPRPLKSGSWLPDGGGQAFVDPGLSTRYSYVSAIPEEAELLLLHGSLTFDHGRRSYVHTAEKLLRPPPAAELETC